MSIESLLIPKTNTPEHYLRSLDDQIKHILNNKSLHSDIKYQLYSQVLNKWIDVHENLRKPTKVTVNKTEPKQVYDMNEDFPKTSKKKAKKLMSFINTLPNVSITPNGSITIDGREVRNSNISDIINDFILNKKSRPPVGAKQLAREMKYNNIPLEIITNKKRLSWFQDNISQDIKSPEINQWSHYH